MGRPEIGSQVRVSIPSTESDNIDNLQLDSLASFEEYMIQGLDVWRCIEVMQI